MIDATAWKAARPAARRVRLLAVLVAILVAVLTAAALVLVHGDWLILLVPPPATYAAWRLARHLLAARAVRLVRPSLPHTGLSAVATADLVARGTTVFDGARWTAVEDEHSVSLTSSAGPGEGPQLPLSVITQLGNSGGGM